jgi:hypothetical protein
MAQALLAIFGCVTESPGEVLETIRASPVSMATAPRNKHTRHVMLAE